MKRLFDFHGGIHPAEHKHESLGGPIRKVTLPTQLIIPLGQHIGAPSRPVVDIGEQVLKGQVIAEGQGALGIPQHAPSSGIVTAIEERPVAHPSGLQARCIVIDCDGADQWLSPQTGALEPRANYRELDGQQLIEQIRNAGIAGMGGAGFPTAVKVAGQRGKPVQTLIINGTECEPYITADDALMREQAADIISGIDILRHIVNPAQVLIGIEDNKPEAIAALRQAAEGHAVEVVVFPTKYPSGGEKQLIEILTGQQVPSGRLPIDHGILCQNVGTTVAIADAVLRGRPLICRITTVTGQAINRPGNFRTLLGTPVAHLLAQAGFKHQPRQRLVMGGPMMGFALSDSAVPIVKTSNCILAPSENELPEPAPAAACIRCGLCAQACPASLLPQQLFWFAQGKEYEKLEAHNLFDCIECGACSWSCPSHIPLVQYYRASKAEIRQQQQAQEKSGHSRQRFEARQERLQREETEKEAKRAARKKAAELKAQQSASDGNSEDPIQAAIERARAKKAAQQQDTGGENKQDKLEKAVTSARKRLDTASTKLEEARAAGSDLVSALQSGVDKTRSKLEQAEQALSDYKATTASSSTAAIPPAASAAQQAIERAKAAREAEASLSPNDKARKQLTSLQARLIKSEQRLAQSRSAGEEDSIVAALEVGIERIKSKIAAIETELAASETGNTEGGTQSRPEKSAETP
ncbi:MAG: electron transport complex subunit RsxC [Parahaliea sp.]